MTLHRQAKGALFYPGCGPDTFEPLERFVHQVGVFHFCDVVNVGLPTVRGQMNKRPRFIHSLEERIDATCTDQAWVKRKRKAGGMDENRPFQKQLKDLSPSMYSETWDVDGVEVIIKAYQEDALTVFESLESMGVFFYRGDSLFELGSGIAWFGQPLFDQLLEKLCDGALIVTDGSNPDPTHLDTPWKNLYRHSHIAYPPPASDYQPENFSYRNRRFTWIGEASPCYGKTYVWKVDRQSHIFT